MSPTQRLANLPIAFFAAIMGLAGLTIAWGKAEQTLALSMPVDGVMLVATGVSFLALLLTYGVKVLRHRDAVLREFRHPVKINFFPTVSVSMILLATASLHLAPQAAETLWMTGIAAHLVFTLVVMNLWIHHGHFEVQHLNPAWFIPAVGNVLVPIAGVPLGHPELSWFFFSTGIVLWLVLLTIVINRMLFHRPIQDRFLPTFFILIAPPAVGFVAYVHLGGELDGFARVLYHFALFLSLMLLTQARRFLSLRFFVSWWAYAFPLAALTVSTFQMYELTGNAFYRLLAAALLAALTFLVAYLLVRTIAAVRQRLICVPEA